MSSHLRQSPDTKSQTHFSAQGPKVQPVFLSSRLDRPHTQLSATLSRSQSVQTAAAARQEHFPPVLVIPALVPSYFWSWLQHFTAHFTAHVSLSYLSWILNFSHSPQEHWTDVCWPDALYCPSWGVFTVAGSDLWNSLTLQIKTSLTLYIFTTPLKNTFYSLYHVFFNCFAQMFSLQRLLLCC